MISHYATGEVNAVNLQFTFGDPLRTHPVIVFIFTVNNDWSQVYLSEEPGDNCLTSGQGSYKMDQGSVAVV